MSSSMIVGFVVLVTTQWARRTDFLSGAPEYTGCAADSVSADAIKDDGLRVSTEVNRPRQSSPHFVKRYSNCTWNVSNENE